MSIDTLVKQPSESRLYTMDFSANLAASETIDSISSVTANISGLTIGTPVVGTRSAQARISGGTVDVLYKVTFVVVTSAGNTLEAEGYLKIENT
jgi:hypothetical protein